MGPSAEQDTFSSNLFQYEFNKLLELLVWADAKTTSMPKHGAKSRLHCDPIEPVSAGDAREHVRDAVQYHYPSSRSARPMVTRRGCSRSSFLTTERIHKHRMYRLHVVKAPKDSRFV